MVVIRIYLGDCNNDQISNEFVVDGGDNLSVDEFVDLWDVSTTLEVHTGEENDRDSPLNNLNDK